MTDRSTLQRAREMEQLAHDLLGIADQLRTGTPSEELIDLSINVERTSLGELAQRLLEFRQNRSAIFPSRIFGETAWDILLTLFVARGAATGVTAEQLRRSCGTSEAANGRWIDLLLEMGLIETVGGATPSGSQVIKLSEQSIMGMIRLMARLNGASLTAC